MSGMTEHPDLLLSAYLDDALSSDERVMVRAHVDACDRCRGRLDELRATARLIGALPALVPTRSLLPHVERGPAWPVWLRPVRLLGSMGTGLFLFLFLASAILNSGSSLGGGTTASERLAAKGQFGAAASALAAENAQKAAGAPPPTGAAVPAAQAPTASNADTAARSAAGTPPPTPSAQFAVATGAATSVDIFTAGPRFGPSPALFLALALLCAIVAFVAHRRLRRS